MAIVTPPVTAAAVVAIVATAGIAAIVAIVTTAAAAAVVAIVTTVAAAAVVAIANTAAAVAAVCAKVRPYREHMLVLVDEVDDFLDRDKLVFNICSNKGNDFQQPTLERYFQTSRAVYQGAPFPASGTL